MNDTDVFRSTAGITPISADTLLLVLKQTKARFYSDLEIQRRANKKEISIAAFIDLVLYSKVSQFSAASTVHCQVKSSLKDCWEKHLFPAADPEHVPTSAPGFEPDLSSIANRKASAKPEKLFLCKRKR